MSETHTRDTASPVAGRAGPRCGARSPVSQPPSSPQGNVSTDTASEELDERVMSPALLREIAEDLFEQDKRRGAAGMLADPGAIVR